MYGYQGRFLNVDLTGMTTEPLPLDESDLKRFIGGAGLGAKLIYSHVEMGMDQIGRANG